METIFTEVKNQLIMNLRNQKQNDNIKKNWQLHIKTQNIKVIMNRLKLMNIIHWKLLIRDLDRQDLLYSEWFGLLCEIYRSWYQEVCWWQTIELILPDISVSRRFKQDGKSCRPWSDCSFRNNLLKINLTRYVSFCLYAFVCIGMTCLFKYYYCAYIWEKTWEVTFKK